MENGKKMMKAGWCEYNNLQYPARGLGNPRLTFASLGIFSNPEVPAAWFLAPGPESQVPRFKHKQQSSNKLGVLSPELQVSNFEPQTCGPAPPPHPIQIWERLGVGRHRAASFLACPVLLGRYRFSAVGRHPMTATPHVLPCLRASINPYQSGHMR